MAKAHATWRVWPHGPIEKLSERVWRVQGDIQGMPMKRVMTIARRSDGGLVVHNGVALGEAEMAEIDAWGKVTTIVVPNGYHRIDAKVFHDRYPAATIAAPAGAKQRVAEVVAVGATYEELPADANVSFETLDGTKQREGVMIVREPSGTTLVFNDAIFNMPHASGFSGFLFRRVTGSSGGPRVSRLFRTFVMADKKAYRAHLERLASVPDLRRIIVSHHEVIDADPAATLRRVAEQL
jgi:hypothetical protein